ncbi:hypothetical protein WR25_06866 [Diploscapter pachys]|uniref:Uncharacterized protein n=1 Tax=Diploscapter pachys TaxID=2018661 RepID=A0A2A2JNV5_9BILA|nr:hypothetical protein WR25_06866 [Diploscapter pachys]
MCNAIVYAIRRQARGHAHLIGIRHEANPCYLEKPPEEEAQQGSSSSCAPSSCSLATPPLPASEEEEEALAAVNLNAQLQ